MTWPQEIKLVSRKIFALAVACNFLIALVFSIQAHSGHQVLGKSYGLAGVEQLAQVTCLKQVVGGPVAPIEHSNNPGCILFCSINSFSFSSFGLAILGLVIFIFEPQSELFQKRIFANLFSTPLNYGWGSSWVAHGPPVF